MPLLVLLTCFGAPALQAQTDPNDVPRPPAAELARFAPFFGTWSMRGTYADLPFEGVTTVQPRVQGWYVEWVNDLKSPGIDRELRQMITWDRAARRYRIWRFETLDRRPTDDEGIVRFEADTLVFEWARNDPDGGGRMFHNRSLVRGDSLCMWTSDRNPTTGARDTFGTLCGRRIPDASAVAASSVAPMAAPPPQPPAAVPALRSPLVDDVPGVARRFVDLPGARLQWLDFGGRGETVILLAGLGNNAWIYSGFGPALARQGFRVVALTRRGHGESEAPASGYALDSLVADVVAFMDTLGVPRAHLVGHSFAGAEMTRLAARHPDRVRRMVYLDAAYDRQAQLQWIGRQPDEGTRPMTDADRASPEAYLAYQRYARRGDLAQAWGPAVERDYRASLERAEDGSVRWRTPLPRYFEMLRSAGEAPPEYAAVRAPSLAVYALRARTIGALSLAPDAPQEMRDSVLAFDRDVVGPWTDASIAQYRAGGGSRCVLNVDAIHHVFLQREPETVALVRDFLRGRRVRCE